MKIKTVYESEAGDAVFASLRVAKERGFDFVLHNGALYRVKDAPCLTTVGMVSSLNDELESLRKYWTNTEDFKRKMRNFLTL